ncbi:MAG: TetR/AcrR family transcriptional regulator [Actinobacteria bacterium]|nr:TetR/AcrR family transcriptional regulator [Actinomycetota bacterium]
MAGGVTRESYFETGLEVLADLGYGGLKLAEVCERLGVTTGSFYHYFPNWLAFTRELVGHWVQVRTTRVAEAVHAEPDPRRRIDIMVTEALALPHGAEAAIRVWSSLDSDVYQVQANVDQQRFEVMAQSALAILCDQRGAELFASWAVYLLVGYEQATLPRNADTAQWISRRMLAALDSGWFTSISDA